MRQLRSLPLVILVLLLAACTLSKQFVLSGESLDALGQQFVQTGKLYDQLLENKSITVEDYRAWATFAKRFQAVYPPLVVAWRMAAASESPAAETKKIEDAIISLKNQLVSFYLSAAKKGV